jgi:hypothetical protein
MKIKIALILLALVSAVSVLHAQTKETRSVSTFTEISFRIPGKLLLTQGNVQKVEIEGTSEALKKIETKVEDGRLSIRREERDSDWDFNNEKFTVYITVKDIEAVTVSGSGSLIGQNKITTEHLNLKVSGSGSLQMDVNASGNIDADVSGSGNLDLKASCKDYSSTVSGSGKIGVAAIASGKSEFNISGYGTIKATGSAKDTQVIISGSGDLLAGDFEVGACSVRISGSGEVEINVKDSLDATITGSGTVSYKGDPHHVNGHSAGSGRVRKM